MAAWLGAGSGDLVQLLERWQRRRGRGSLFADRTTGLSPRVGAAAGGLLAGLARRGLRHARVRASSAEGRVILGDDEVVDLPLGAARACIAALREAACLSACAPHCSGTFAVPGCIARIEAYACVDGERAFVHLAGEDETRLASSLAVLPELDADALSALRSSLDAEELLGARLVSRAGDAASVLCRHADLTLLAHEMGLPHATCMTDALQAALCSVVAGASWRIAWEPVAECAAWARRHAGTAARPMRLLLRACRSEAAAEARAGLFTAFARG